MLKHKFNQISKRIIITITELIRIGGRGIRQKEILLTCKCNLLTISNKKTKKIVFFNES